MASNLSPLYIAEVAPARMRGRLVSLNQLTIVIGILAAQLLNMVIAQKVPNGSTAAMIAQSWNGQFGWRWMFTLVAAPSLLFFIAAMFVPESPRWLVKNGQVGSREKEPLRASAAKPTRRRKRKTSGRPSRRRKFHACALRD